MKNAYMMNDAWMMMSNACMMHPCAFVKRVGARQRARDRERRREKDREQMSGCKRERKRWTVTGWGEGGKKEWGEYV